MKSVLIFLGGFVAGIIVTILVAYFITSANQPNDGLLGLTLFAEKGECISATSKNKSCEIEIFQVLAPDAALGYLKYYTDEELGDSKTYRNYDISNEVVVLLLNNENKTYYDNQKIDMSNKCARQIGTYQYNTNSNFEKTVPAVVIE